MCICPLPVPRLNGIVTEPPLRLIDDQERDVGDRYYKSGSTIDLQCQVSRSYLYKELQNILKSVWPNDGRDRLDTVSVDDARNTVDDIFMAKKRSNSDTMTSTTTITTTSSTTAISTTATTNTRNTRNIISNPSTISTTTVSTNSKISINMNQINAINSRLNSNNHHNHNNNNINIQMNSSKRTREPNRTSMEEDYYSNLLQFNGNQSDRQRELLEKQFNSLVFWAKDDEQLANTARRRIIT